MRERWKGHMLHASVCAYLPSIPNSPSLCKLLCAQRGGREWHRRSGRKETWAREENAWMSLVQAWWGTRAGWVLTTVQDIFKTSAFFTKTYHLIHSCCSLVRLSLSSFWEIKWVWTVWWCTLLEHWQSGHQGYEHLLAELVCYTKRPGECLFCIDLKLALTLEQKREEKKKT